MQIWTMKARTTYVSKSALQPRREPPRKRHSGANDIIDDVIGVYYIGLLQGDE